MVNKMIYFFVLVSALVLAGSASAVELFWDKGGAGNLWNDPANWNPEGLPAAADTARIVLPGDANRCIIDSSVTAQCTTLYVGAGNVGPCYLEMTGGTLTMDGHIRIGELSNSNATFTMSGGTTSMGTTNSTNGRLWVGMNGTGTFIMKGGVLNVYDKVEIGKNANGVGTVYMEGGTLNFSGNSTDLEIGSYGHGTLYMTGGVINLQDNIKLSQGNATTTTGVAQLYLYGGAIHAGNLRNPADGIYGSPKMDITEGLLTLPGDYRTIVNDYISRGWIVAYDGVGMVDVVYAPDPNTTTVTGRMPEPELAWRPNPLNRATAEPEPVLSWNQGQYAVSHDVYFGTDFNDVNDANNVAGLWPEFKGNQNILTYNPGKLDLETTYYWRIDEVNSTSAAPAGSPWKGTVWRFTTSNYLVVDNMESYGSADTPGTPPPAGSRIWFTWKDGEGWVTPSTVAGNGSGAVVDSSSITHGGSQSLQFMYDNDGKNIFGSTTRNYSEITIDTSYLPVGQDWTQGGVTTLSLWFYGNLNNYATATDQMYVKVNNVRKDYDGDVNAIMQAQWHEWNIDLTKLGLDLTKVTSLAIGIGNSANTTPGGSGVVYFDDIRLYRPR